MDTSFIWLKHHLRPRYLVLIFVILMLLTHTFLLILFKNYNQEIQQQHDRLLQGTEALHHFSVRFNMWNKQTQIRLLHVLHAQIDVLKPDWKRGESLITGYKIYFNTQENYVDELKLLWSEGVTWRKEYNRLKEKDEGAVDSILILRRYISEYKKIEGIQTVLLNKLDKIIIKQLNKSNYISKKEKENRAENNLYVTKTLDEFWQKNFWLVILNLILSISSLIFVYIWLRYWVLKFHAESEKAQQERALKEQKSTLQHTEFVTLSNLCHALSPTLESTQYQLNRLLNACKSSESSAYTALSTIDIENNKALKIIDKINELSKIETEENELNLSIVNVLKLMENLKSDLKDVCQGNDIVWYCDKEIINLFTDEDKIKRILFQLLKNACQFTEKGKVIFSTRFDKKAARFIFEISDEGVGISLAQQSNIFNTEPDNLNTALQEKALLFLENKQDLGLGLALVKRLSYCLGGELSVISSVGHGSVFSFSIPQTVT